MANESVVTAKVKILGSILVALLGLCGTVLSIWLTQRTANTDATLQFTVEQLNNKTIPAMQGLVDELRQDNKVLVEMCAGLRERLAAVEATLKVRRHRFIASSPTATAGAKSKPIEAKLEKLLTKKSPEKIPMLQMQQMAK